MQEANVSWLSFGICLIPIIVFFASLVWFKLQGWLAAALTVFIATLIAIFYNDIMLALSSAPIPAKSSLASSSLIPTKSSSILAQSLITCALFSAA